MFDTKVEMSSSSTNIEMIQAMDLINEFESKREFYFPSFWLWAILVLVLFIPTAYYISIQDQTVFEDMVCHLVSFTFYMLAMGGLTSLIEHMWCGYRTNAVKERIMTFVKNIDPNSTSLRDVRFMDRLSDILDKATGSSEWNFSAPSFSFTVSDPNYIKRLFTDCDFFDRSDFPKILSGSQRSTRYITGPEVKLGCIYNIAKILEVEPTVSYDIDTNTIIVEC